MLEPSARYVYLDALKPPAGFSLDLGVGTTFSLDLETLLAVPLGFAMLDAENERGALARDPVALLHALGRCADRVTMFCQAGRIAAPTRHHPLFARLEPMVVEVEAPHDHGCFHAKTWLLRFTSEDGRVVYRFICLSRNLTPDRSWDTVLVLDGDLADRARAIARNHPLGDFIAMLPSLAQLPLAAARADAVALLADEVRRVKFEAPDPFEDLDFWPLGLPHTRKSPLDGRMDRLLVVSPFVSDGFLHGLAEASALTLVSRPGSLEAIEPGVLKEISAVYVLDDAATEEDSDVDAEEADEGARRPSADVRGLHAKLFVADQGWHASVWTGSANATDAAFTRNIEFLVQLRGKKSLVGIDALLGVEGEEGGFGALLRPFQIGEQMVHDPEVLANEEQVEAARRQIARAGLRLRVEAAGDRYDMVLRAPDRSQLDLSTVRATCWPAAVSASLARDLEALVRDGHISFAGLTVQALTSFITFEVAAGDGPNSACARFALNLPLEGAPEDRFDRVLSAVLGDRDRLLRYLLFLLARDQDAGAAGLMLVARGDGGTCAGAADAGSLPLFEEMLRALARSPDKLDVVWRLIEGLRRTAEGAALLPEGLDQVWKAIWAARVARREAST
jgi:hypothetical protein